MKGQPLTQDHEIVGERKSGHGVSRLLGNGGLSSHE
jgi:hypothetical protein